jgi:hypothetical protein
MRTFRIAFGLTLLTVSLLYSIYAIYTLMRFGTCASGGPYVSARQCAPGSGLMMMGVTVSIFGAIIGAGLTGSHRVAFAAWGLGFTALAAGFFMGAFAPSAQGQPDGLLWLNVGLGAMFLVMGLPGLWLAARKDDDDTERSLIINGPSGPLKIRPEEAGGPAAIVAADLPRSY